MPLVSFDTPWKYQKLSGFLMYLGGIERDQWHEMGKEQTHYGKFKDYIYKLHWHIQNLVKYLLDI